jgi:hypothetical protein
MRTLASFGADPFSADNSAALQAALNFGGDIEIGVGSFVIGSTVVATRPVRLVGDKTKSAFLVSPSVSENYPLIHVNPNMSYGGDGYEFRDFQIAPQTPESKACAIFFNTTAAGKFLRRPVIDGLVIGQMADQCITSSNSNGDGLIAPQIANNILMGGIFLQNAGDSINIDNNLISGEGIGVYATFVAGAACLFVGRNNITSKGGALYLVNPLAPTIEANNIESVVYGYNGGVNASVYMQGAISAMMVGNNVNTGSLADCIRLNGCRRTYIESGHLQVSGTTKKHIRRENDMGSIIGPCITFLDLALGNEVAGYIQ